jgi:hypothetical protein
MPILGIMASSTFVSSSAFDSIATSIVGSGGSSVITFSSIPSTYSHLQIRYISKPSTATAQNLNITFNNDSSTSYSFDNTYGAGIASTISNYNSTAVAQMRIGNGSGSTYLANVFASGIVDILDYTSTAKQKTTRWINGYECNASSANVDYGMVQFGSGGWFPSTIAAINRIDISAGTGNLAQYSVFALYGVK